MEDLNIRRTCIQRQAYRMNYTHSVKDKFDPALSLTVHWDGKLFPVLTSKNRVDQFPVLASGF